MLWEKRICMSLACSRGANKTEGNTEEEFVQCVHVSVCVSMCLIYSLEAKTLLMDSKWLWEVNKQTVSAATTTDQTLAIVAVQNSTLIDVNSDTAEHT